jgi:hypothetical protein
MLVPSKYLLSIESRYFCLPSAAFRYLLLVFCPEFIFVCVKGMFFHKLTILEAEVHFIMDLKMFGMFQSIAVIFIGFK